jgi:putative sterol carrier protein
VSARAFFESLESRIDAGRAARLEHSYLFVIEDEGQWFVALEEGRLRVTEGAAGEPDVTIRASGETFTKIREGRQNPATAYMTGKIKIEGDLGAAMKLKSLFG